MMISVVVPCRNEARYIRRFLRSVLNQRVEGVEWEVIVADGMSDDGTWEILQAEAATNPRIRVIRNPRLAVAAGLNSAIKAARGDVIVRMDVHTEYAPDYVEQCRRVLEETGADSVGGPWVAEGNGYVGRAVAAVFQSPFGVGPARSRRRGYEGPTDTVYLGCWPRRTFERFGLFDEGLVRNQDDEFNYRILRAGGMVWQSPRIRSFYRPRDSLSALFKQYMQYGFWKVAVIKKHGAPASWRHVVPGVSVLLGGLLPLVAALGHWCGTLILGTALHLWLGLVGAYLFGVGLASLVAAKRQGWDLLPVLPAVFAAYHVSYGVGFLLGVMHFVIQRKGCDEAPALCAELTR